MFRNGTLGRSPFWLALRFIVSAFATLLIPPFVVVALAPVLLVLAPVALVAIPFMLSAFAGEAREVRESIAPRALTVLERQAVH